MDDSKNIKDQIMFWRIYPAVCVDSIPDDSVLPPTQVRNITGDRQTFGAAATTVEHHHAGESTLRVEDVVGVDATLGVPSHPRRTAEITSLGADPLRQRLRPPPLRHHGLVGVGLGDDRVGGGGGGGKLILSTRIWHINVLINVFYCCVDTILPRAARVELWRIFVSGSRIFRREPGGGFITLAAESEGVDVAGVEEALPHPRGRQLHRVG